MTTGRQSSAHYLPPFVLQVVGIAIIVGASAFWALTGHESVLIMGTGVTLTGIGAYSGLHVSLRKDLLERDDEGKP